MNINIKKSDLPQSKLRKIKLEHLEKDEKIKIVNYNWKLKAEYADETIEDFHLFCLSIVKDLMKSNFKTNERGEISYGKLKKSNKRSTIKYLHYLYDNILNEQMKKSKQK